MSDSFNREEWHLALRAIENERHWIFMYKESRVSKELMRYYVEVLCCRKNPTGLLSVFGDEEFMWSNAVRSLEGMTATHWDVFAGTVLHNRNDLISREKT